MSFPTKSPCCGARIVPALRCKGVMCAECAGPICDDGFCSGHNAPTEAPKPRRGPAEALAMELWEAARGVKNDMLAWDELSDEFASASNALQREAMLAVARHVLRKFEGKVL